MAMLNNQRVPENLGGTPEKRHLSTGESSFSHGFMYWFFGDLVPIFKDTHMAS